MIATGFKIQGDYITALRGCSDFAALDWGAVTFAEVAEWQTRRIQNPLS